jgi:hypothetical protein
MTPGVIFIIQLILRVLAVNVCLNRAKKLNRSTARWAFFGFVFPIIAMIWIQFMKPVLIWETNLNINKRPMKNL